MSSALALIEARAGLRHPLHDQRIALRHVLREQRRPVRRPDSGSISQVLVGHWQAVQQANRPAAGHLVVGGRSAVRGRVESPGDDRVDDWIERLNPSDVRGHDLACRHLPAPQHPRDANGVLHANITHTATVEDKLGRVQWPGRWKCLRGFTRSRPKVGA